MLPGAPELVIAVPHLVYFGLFRPLIAWRHRNSLRREGYVFPPRVPYYRQATTGLWTFGLFSLVTLATLWITSKPGPAVASEIFIYSQQVPSRASVWSGLLPFEWPSAFGWLLGLGVYAAMTAADLSYSRRCLRRGEPHMYFATPSTREERLWWIAFATAAGVAEELTWRGVQPELIAQATGALWPAVALCSLTFGIGHIRQGWGWVPIVAIFALACHGLTLFTGSLYVAMVVHVAVNVTVGLGVRPRGSGL